jgi:hypothetical protein
LVAPPELDEPLAAAHARQIARWELHRAFDFAIEDGEVEREAVTAEGSWHFVITTDEYRYEAVVTKGLTGEAADLTRERIDPGA